MPYSPARDKGTIPREFKGKWNNTPADWMTQSTVTHRTLSHTERSRISRLFECFIIPILGQYRELPDSGLITV